MKIKDLMTVEVESLDPDASLEEAAGMMSAYDIGSVPILEGGRVVGLVTDRDIVLRGVAAGLDPRETKVDEIMSTDLVQCSEDTDLERAERLMLDNQVSRILVLDEDGRLAGIATLSDISAEMDGGAESPERELAGSRRLVFN
jgi:CBS domain-containing protein